MKPGALALVAAFLAGAVGPAAAQNDVEKYVAIRANRVITISGEEIENGVIVLLNGKVENVGAGLEFPRNAKVIDARDRVVMPGMICAWTRYGMSSRPRRELHANWTVADEFFPANDLFDPLARAGFTAAAIYPPGSGLPGRALVTHTAGPASQRIVADKSYLFSLLEKKELREALVRADKEIEKAAEARKQFDEQQKKAAQSAPASQPASASATASAPASQPAFKPPPIAPEIQPLIDLIQKKADFALMIRLQRASDLVHMTDVLKEREFPVQYVLPTFPANDFYQVVKQLGQAKASVLTRAMMSNVSDSAERFSLPAELTKAGASVALIPNGDSERSFDVFLPNLSVLVANGWPRKDALKSVTLNPAKVLKLDAQFGSIEKGRSADFIFLDADPLAPGARVREVMINGEIVLRTDSKDRP